jgi:hypothetical protein
MALVFLEIGTLKEIGGVNCGLNDKNKLLNEI